jgi:putative addiction module killer protein
MVLYRLLEYRDIADRQPFGQWFDSLDPQAAAKVNVALTRLANGNISNVKGIGGGVLDVRVDFGPGYRIYFGFDGRELVILLGGGSKRRQQQDIEAAIVKWADYKRRKRKA